MAQRLRILAAAINQDALALQRAPEAGNALKAVCLSFAYVVEDVPTHHLEECIARVMRQKERDDYPLKAPAINRAYQEYIPELQARAETHSAMQEYLLRSGQGSLDLMTLQEFKVKHNLPAEWELGQLYPPESDLYGLVGTVSREDAHEYQCDFCRDSGWTRRPYDKVLNTGPMLVRCECGQAGAPWMGE